MYMSIVLVMFHTLTFFFFLLTKAWFGEYKRPILLIGKYSIIDNDKLI